MRDISWWLVVAIATGLPIYVRAQAETEPEVTAEVPAEEEIDPDFASAIAADVERAETEPGTAAAPAGQTFLRKMNPDISLILDVGVGWFGNEAHILQGGHALDDNGFGIQGLELAASASVDPFFRFDMNFELSHVHVEEAYLTTLALPLNLQTRLGYFNAQFGRHNPQHLHSWRFVSAPLSHTRFMSEEHFSGAGGELSALLPLPWYAMVLGQVFGTNKGLGLRSSSFATVDLSSSGRTDGLEDFVYIGRLVNFVDLSDDWSLNVGVSGAWGQSPYVPDNFTNLYGADVYLKWRPISTGEGAMAVGITGEYVLRDTQVPGDSVRDHGGYLQVDFQLDRYWITSVRGDWVGRVQGPAPAGSPMAGRQQRGSLMVGYMPTHFSKIRLQLDAGKDRQNDATIAGFVQLEVSAGEHGAHVF